MRKARRDPARKHREDARGKARPDDCGGMEPSTMPRTHNGGPPLEDHVSAWGANGIGNYFDWRRAYRQAWKSVSRESMLRRLRKADACGLTYEEYTRVLLDTGRYLQPGDRDLIERIKASR